MDWNFIDSNDSVAERISRSVTGDVAARSAATSSSDGKDNSEQSRKEKQVSFLARDPLYSIENLVLDDKTRDQLVTLKSRFATHSLVYESWGMAETDPCGKHIAFNLYGPPGTGKTMCVEAIARSFGKKLIDVSYSEIESKYVGETGKNIVAAFKAAVDQDALLFFDEADSILGQRMTSVTQAADQAVNVSRAVMLKQLDAFDGIVAFATNLAKNFDSAFVRRIPIHVEIPLPDENGRRKIAEKLLPDKVPFKPRLDFSMLAAKTSGMSGGDIKNVIVNSVSAIASKNWAEMNSDALMDVFLKQAEWTLKAKQNVGRNVHVVTDDVSLESIGDK